MTHILPQRPTWPLKSNTALRDAAIAAVALMILTSLHHAYGAFAYNTPWRLHVVFVAVPVALAIAGLASLAGVTGGGPRRILEWTTAAMIALFPLIGIGYFEGGYNHTLKDVLFLTGASSELMHQLFPAPAYEMPNDIVFEVTGIAQFVVALVATGSLVKAVRRRS